MRLVNCAKLPARDLSALEQELPEQGTLLEVINWGLACRPPALVAEVLAQDEYTHDVVVRWRDGLVLVYDTT
jgi:hypothetical protein